MTSVGQERDMALEGRRSSWLAHGCVLILCGCGGFLVSGRGYGMGLHGT